MSDIKEWGPTGWNFMHAITFSYPTEPTDDDKKEAINFFRSIERLLPCMRCREHYKHGLEKHPVEKYVHSRDALSRWLVNFHNSVNARLGKPISSYEEVYKKYMGADVKPVKCPAPGKGNRKEDVLTADLMLQIEQEKINRREGRAMALRIAIPIIIVICFILLAFAILAWQGRKCNALARVVRECSDGSCKTVIK